MNNNSIKYKNTNNDFVPQIPENWELRKIKFASSLQSGFAFKSSEYSEEGYPVFRIGDILDEININNCPKYPIAKSKGLVDFRVYNGDILIALTGATIGKTALIKNLENFGLLNQRVAKLEKPTKFLYYSLLSKPIQEQIKLISNGSAQENISNKTIENFYIPFPSADQQVAITNFLDKKCEQINQFIADKKQLINLLKEQRQSVIDKAVTRGINSNDELQESPVSFLPSFPKNWSLRRLGSIGTFSKGGNISRADLLFGVKDTNAILYGDIYTKYDIKVTEVVNQIKSSVAKNSIKLEYNDLLFTGSGETKEDIGKCIVNKCAEDVYAGGDVIIFKQNEFDSLFISYSQNSSFAKEQKAISSKGDIIVHQYGSKLKNVIMPFPAIEEQQKIVDFIIKETKTIDETIFKTEEELRLVAEYKEALISNAVTGQLHIA